MTTLGKILFTLEYNCPKFVFQFALAFVSALYPVIGKAKYKPLFQGICGCFLTDIIAIGSSQFYDFPIAFFVKVGEDMFDMHFGVRPGSDDLELKFGRTYFVPRAQIGYQCLLLGNVHILKVYWSDLRKCYLSAVFESNDRSIYFLFRNNVLRIKFVLTFFFLIYLGHGNPSYIRVFFCAA